uniref:outer membrane beta-barrel protein n=1 Tax=Photobacterium sanctipauli TaxID=1342794 RepID=UPI00056C9525
MKKPILALSLISLFSSPTSANKQGFYVGADLGANFVGSMYLDSHIGLVAGYDIPVSPKVVIGIEGEYRNMGSDSAFDNSIGTDIGANVSASSYGVNIKPKYYFNDKIYGAVVVGLHRITYEEKLAIGNDSYGGKDPANG